MDLGVDQPTREMWVASVRASYDITSIMAVPRLQVRLICSPARLLDPTTPTSSGSRRRGVHDRSWETRSVAQCGTQYRVGLLSKRLEGGQGNTPSGSWVKHNVPLFRWEEGVTVRTGQHPDFGDGLPD